MEGLFPTDDALSTSVFTEKPNKPLEQQSQQRGLRRELGQASAPSWLERGWMDKATQPGHWDRSQLEELLPCMEQWIWELLAVEMWLWHKLRGLCGVTFTPPACSTSPVRG